MAKAVYKVIRNGQSEWVHASQRGQTVKLRWFGPEYEQPQVLNLLIAGDAASWNEIQLGRKRFEISEIAGLTNDVLPFSADELRVDADSDKWAEVFVRLQQLGDITPVNEDVAAIAQPLGDRSPIPQTRLRRFYEMMRLLNETDLQRGIANYLTENGRANRIQVMFKESESHFARYANLTEAFHDRNEPDWLMDYANQQNVFAKCVVARIRPNANYDPVTIRGGPQIRVVDYELSLFRTTGGATFEDGKAGTSSGSGGMDLLLQDDTTRIPVIGEIKASTDRDLFLALIQSLTYAIELTTENQMNRLVKSYGQSGFEITNRQCDILLIYDKRGELPVLMDQTKELATQLLAEPMSPVARRIRRIALVSADLESQAGIELTCEWSTTIR